jgi:predicted RNA binding protein YcfA (HicA-like mRNA interferase family)
VFNGPDVQQSKLPLMSGPKLLKILCNKFGFKIINVDGSHYTLSKENQMTPILLIVPMHNELSRGTLRKIVSKSQISRDKFLDSLR